MSQTEQPQEQVATLADGQQIRVTISVIKPRKAPSQGPNVKFWMFTINNPAGIQVPRAWPGVDYCAWQLEEGAEGTQHLQGYVGFKTRQRLSALKKLHQGAHWEPRKGSHEEAKVGGM